MLHPFDVDIVVADGGLLLGDLLLANLLTQSVEALVAVQRLAQESFLFVSQREQAKHFVLAAGIADLVGQCPGILQLQDGDGGLLLLQIELAEQQQGIDKRLFGVVQLMGLARRIEVVAGQREVAALQVGLANLVLEQGRLWPVAPFVDEVEGVEEVDQRQIEVSLIPVEARQHDERVAQQGGIADGVEVVGCFIGILERFLGLLLLLVELDDLVGEQAEEQRIVEISRLLLGIDIFAKGQLGLLQGTIEVATDGADPGAGQWIARFRCPVACLGQMHLGILKLLIVDVIAGAQQPAVDLQLALFEVGGCQLLLKLAEQRATAALVVRL